MHPILVRGCRTLALKSRYILSRAAAIQRSDILSWFWYHLYITYRKYQRINIIRFVDDEWYCQQIAQSITKMVKKFSCQFMPAVNLYTLVDINIIIWRHANWMTNTNFYIMTSMINGKRYIITIKNFVGKWCIKILLYIPWVYDTQVGEF